MHFFWRVFREIGHIVWKNLNSAARPISTTNFAAWIQIPSHVTQWARWQCDKYMTELDIGSEWSRQHVVHCVILLWKFRFKSRHLLLNVTTMFAVRQSSAGRPRSDLSLEKKEDLEKRLESMSGCLTNRPRKTSAPTSKGRVTHHWGV